MKRIFVAIGVLAVAGGAFYYLKNANDPVVSTVGDYKITKKDVGYRNQIQKIFYPADNQEYGQLQLEKAFTYAQIMKNNGAEISDKTLEEEEARIDQNTRSPETLNKIKEIFSGDKAAYRKVFILPTYAERVIQFDFFNKKPEFQANSLKRVRDFIVELKNSKMTLGELAKTRELTAKAFTLSETRGMEWAVEKSEMDREHEAGGRGKFIDASPGHQAPPDVQKHLESDQLAQSKETVNNWINNVLSKINPGDVFQEPVDYGDNWLVVRYQKKAKSGEYLMEGVIFPKDSFSDWFEAEKAKIK